jgi:hypothetical protein
MNEITELDTKTSLLFSHYDPNMVKWFDETVKSRRENHDHTKDKKLVVDENKNIFKVINSNNSCNLCCIRYNLYE